MPRRRDRTTYTTTSVFGSVGNCERFCVALAVATVGPLTDREHKLAIEFSHAMSAIVLDHEQNEAELAAKVLEMQRLFGVA